MKIDFAAQLLDANDAVVLEDEKPAKIITLLKRAVLADYTPQGQPIPADDKYKRFELYLKLKSADNETDFTLDEIALLDNAVLVFPTLISGQLHYLLTKK